MIMTHVNCVLNNAGYLFCCVVYLAGRSRVVIIVIVCVAVLLLLFVQILILIYKRKRVITSLQKTHTHVVHRKPHSQHLYLPRV